MKFRDLNIGDTFDFINPNNTYNCSFLDTCTKISARKYKSVNTKLDYLIGSINCPVYHVNYEKDYKFQLYVYDVWGNKKDDFEVNDVFRIDAFVYLNESNSTKEIIQIFKDIGFIDKHVHNSRIEITATETFDYKHACIYVTDSSCVRPLFELRRVEL